jgi:hypothetical protein
VTRLVKTSILAAISAGLALGHASIQIVSPKDGAVVRPAKSFKLTVEVRGTAPKTHFTSTTNSPVIQTGIPDSTSDVQNSWLNANLKVDMPVTVLRDDEE